MVSHSGKYVATLSACEGDADEGTAVAKRQYLLLHPTHRHSKQLHAALSGQLLFHHGKPLNIMLNVKGHVGEGECTETCFPLSVVCWGAWNGSPANIRTHLYFHPAKVKHSWQDSFQTELHTEQGKIIRIRIFQDEE